MIHKYLIASALARGHDRLRRSAQSVRAGIEAWQRADYAPAVAIWRPLAEKGDADAAFNLGQAYRLGRGVTINLAAAQTWFERAANKGHIDAQTTLGLMLFENGDRAAGAAVAQAGGRQRRAPRAARLRHRPVQRRRGKAGPHPRLCLCEPRGGAGPGAGSGNARATRPDSAGSSSARKRSRSPWRRPKPRPRRGQRRHDPNRSSAQAAAAKRTHDKSFTRSPAPNQTPAIGWLADPARRLLATRFRRSAVQEVVGIAWPDTSHSYVPGRTGHPPASGPYPDRSHAAAAAACTIGARPALLPCRAR